MEKSLFNPAIFILILIVLSSAVIAAHTATVSLVGYIQNYETNNMQFLLEVKNNLGSTDSITNISVSHPGYNTTSIQNPTFPWASNGDINWYGGTIPAIWSGYFYFNATAQQVSADTPFTWTVTTIDNTGASQANILSVTILNDSIPPNITSIIPNDYSFVKNDTINFNINVQELETSISPNNFNMSFDDNNPMQTTGAIKDNIIMNNIGGNVFSGTLDTNNPSKIDLSSGSKFLDYKIYGLSDAAGNQYTESGFAHHIYIDTEYPNVALNQPENNLLTNQYLYNITFNMTENSFEANGQGLFSPQVNCTANLGPNSYGPQSYTNNVTNGIFAANLTGLTDGSYLFNIQCTDKAGYVSTTVTRTILLDTTGPVISLTSPANNSIIINGTNILLNVTDSPAGVGSIWYDDGLVNTTISSAIDTSNWNEGINNIVVYANDTLDNVNKIELNFTIDKTAPVINLVEPFNNTVIKSSGDFVFNATDNYDNILTCNLFMDGINIYTIGGNSGQDTRISDDLGLTEGYHSWYVSCIDDVTLAGVSETRNVTVDTTAPQITNLTQYIILNETNDNDGVIDINLNITDTNGLSACEIYVNNTLRQTNTTPDFNFNLTASNNPYSIQVGCNDTVDNWMTLPEIKIYYDNIAPVISGVLNSSITSTSVIITWDTDELSDSNVTLNGTTNLDNTRVLNHSVSISSLIQLTQYIYNVTSRDRWNNTASVLNLNFNTTATPPSSPSPAPSSSPGGGPSNNNDENETIIINTATGNISKAPSAPAPKEENNTATAELAEGPKFTGLTIMDNLKSSLPLAVIAGIITLIILTGLYKISHPRRLNPSMHKHINMEYRQEEVKDDDVFED